jgi:hypothetical protein
VQVVEEASADHHREHGLEVDLPGAYEELDRAVEVRQEPFVRDTVEVEPVPDLVHALELGERLAVPPLDLRADRAAEVLARTLADLLHHPGIVRHRCDALVHPRVHTAVAVPNRHVVVLARGVEAAHDHAL